MYAGRWRKRFITCVRAAQWPKTLLAAKVTVCPNVGPADVGGIAPLRQLSLDSRVFYLIARIGRQPRNRGSASNVGWSDVEPFNNYCHFAAILSFCVPTFGALSGRYRVVPLTRGLRSTHVRTGSYLCRAVSYGAGGPRSRTSLYTCLRYSIVPTSRELLCARVSYQPGLFCSWVRVSCYLSPERGSRFLSGLRYFCGTNARLRISGARCFCLKWT